MHISLNFLLRRFLTAISSITLDLPLGLRLSFCLSLLLHPAFSQVIQEYSSKDKKAIKHYEEALRYYDGRKSEDALKYLQKAIDADPNFVEAYTMMCYVYSDMKLPEKAIESVKKALAVNPEFYPGNYYTLGALEIGLARYKEARANFQKFLERKSPNTDMNNAAKRGIKNCDFAVVALENPVPFKPMNAGSGLNSQYDEYFPSITADEQTFLFTRKLPGKDADGWQEDFYISNKLDGQWMPASSIGPKINTPGNEGAPCLSTDGQILFFVACETEYGYGVGRQGFGSCDLFYSLKDGVDWTPAQNAGSPVNSRAWETQPSFSSDGKTLYFIRGLKDNKGRRSQDIWTSTLKEDGKWTVPIRVPGPINTDGNEESVYIHPDNQTLYFSSDGHPGMGGLDIFMSRRQPNGQWGEPINLGYPINTCNDENSLLVSREGKLAYFASDRPGGLGGLDIYSFELYEQARPGKTTYVKGKVYDAVTKKPLVAAVEVVDLQTGEVLSKQVSSKRNGEFLICLPLNRNYAFNASKSGYLFRSENFELTGQKDFQPLLVNIPLSPIEKDSVVILKNVFFETAKYDLKQESRIELDKLVDFLTKNPTLKIELGGHTDDVGDNKANQVLSENRARSVYNYLAEKGIPKERLSYKGYGETKPVVPNDSDVHRSLNRRTEFKILSK